MKAQTSTTRTYTFAIAALCAFLGVLVLAQSSTAAPPLLKQFCKDGSGAGECSIPRGLAIDQSSGHLYVADQQNSRINEFTAWGAFVKAWGWGVRDGTHELQTCGPEASPPSVTCQAGLSGSGSGQLAIPTGITVDAAGAVYVVDHANRRVQKFGPDGSFILTLGGEVNKTTTGNLCTAASGDICGAGIEGSAGGFFESWRVSAFLDIGPENHLFVGDKERVQIFDLSGSHVGDIPIPGELVHSLSVADSGDLYVSYFDIEKARPKPDVHKLSATGIELCKLGGIKGPRGIATDADGDVYVLGDESGSTSDPSVIRRFTSDCSEVERFGEGELAGGPTGTGSGLATSSACGIEGSDLFVTNSFPGESFVNLYGPLPDPGICPPPVAAPSIESQFATSASSTEAVLKARINPHFWSDTRYFVQFGTEKCSDGGCETSHPASPGALLTKSPADTGVLTPDVFLSHLEPDTTYHYRFVAQSGGGGPVSGQERSFHTRPLLSSGDQTCPNPLFRVGTSARLPDCRAYELVSPLDKDNGDIAFPNSREFPGGGDVSIGLNQAAADSGRVTFASQRAFADAVAAPFVTQYLAERGEAGWSTSSISPPRSSHLFYAPGSAYMESLFKAFTSDLCSGWVLQDSDLTLTSDAPVDVPNLYRRSTCVSEAPYEVLTSTPPPGFSYDETSDFAPEVQGFSADGGVTVFAANASLEVAEGGSRPPLSCASRAQAQAVSYQWLRNGSAIAGATEPTYTPGSEDEGTSLQCETTAAGLQGVSTAVSTTLRIEPAPAVSPPEPGNLDNQGVLPASPTLTGTPAVGQTLTCTPGIWKGNPTIAYQWQRDGNPIVGAESSGYVLQAVDKGATVQCRTRAANAGGAALADSAPVVVGAEPPTVTAPPTISGIAEVGQPLTCEPGTWSNSPSFAYQWLRNGANILGGAATSPTRTLVAADAGKAIQCRVTATNSDATAQASSDRVVPPTGPAMAPPQLSATGAVTGTAEIGQALTCEPGSWSGSPAFSYKWLRNGAGIAGATESSYTLTSEDLKTTIQCQVTAVNAGGSVVSTNGSAEGARYVKPVPPVGAAVTQSVPHLYVSEGSGLPRLVSVLPDGSPNTLWASAGTRYATLSGRGRSDSLHTAVSADGERIIWSQQQFDQTSGDLYMRLNATEPQSAVSGGQCTEAAKACTIPVSVMPESRFVSANPNGTRVLYTAGTGATELYEAEIEEVGGQQVATSQLIASNLKGVMGASEDATRVYFASTQVLSGSQQNSEGAVALAGEPNLYLYQKGQGFTFVAGLTGTDVLGHNLPANTQYPSPVSNTPNERIARVSPDGLHAAFTSTATPTGFDNTDQATGEPDGQVFVFDAASGTQGKLFCASCNPSGTRPSGGRLVGHAETGGDFWAAAVLPGWNSQFQPTRFLSDDGRRLFFNAFDSLVPGDNNGKADVYQWEAPGKGTCTEQSPSFSGQNGGCISLISSGQSVLDSEFLDATPSGSDVFFITQSSLVPQDYGLLDVYDARVNGGFAPPSPAPPGCEGEACQSPPPAPQEQTPASATFRGAGNVREAPPTRCRKGQRKVRRAGKGRCVRKQTGKNRSKRRANAERRAGR